jgi:hypothetical protein
MSPIWIWMQVAIVVFVLIGMIIAITKLVGAGASLATAGVVVF